MSQSPIANPWFLAHLLAFAAAAVVCVGSAARARRIDDPDTSRGLVALLALSGAWASALVGYLLAPSPPLAVAFYQVGLVVGLATVGPWLYFCSAYTDRSLHRNPTYRRVAVGVFLAIVAVKLTNPLHGLYFTTTVAETPFPHLAVRHGVAHWLVMGFAYALSAIGVFVLFERMAGVSYDTRPLLALVGIMGLPVVLDVVGATTPYLVDVTYEPLGVATFAVGVLFVFLGRFQAVQVAGAHDDPVIVLDDHDRVREYSAGAGELFPALADAQVIDEPLWELLPDVAEALGTEAPVIAVDRGGATRHYQLSESPFTAGGAQLGRLLAFTDITHRERYRTELERQNERLDAFASMVSHDLRNPLAVAMGHVDLAREERDDEHLETAANALDRMEGLIEDVLALARQGRPIDETGDVSLSALARRAWGVVETAGADLRVEDDLAFLADPDRLQQLLENLFRNSVEHAGPDVTIRVGAMEGGDGFFVADDGPGIPETERTEVFESGYSTAEDGTGFGLAIVREIADAHGWSVRATESEAGGARFEITGVTVA